MNPCFVDWSRGSERIALLSVSREIPAGGLTPLRAYEKIRHCGPSFLLESADSERKEARFSLIGWDPFLVASLFDDRLDILSGKNLRTVKIQGDPMPVLRDLVNRFRTTAIPGLGPFQGGLVGYMNYDLVRKWERVPGRIPPEGDLPEAAFMACSRMLLFDQGAGKITVLFLVCPEGLPPLRRLPREAEEEVEFLLKGLASPEKSETTGRGVSVSQMRSEVSREEFFGRVKRARDYIVRGEVIQVVLSQRFSGEVKGDDFQLYGTLRTINPSPYMFYLDFGDRRIIGSSPEMLVRLTHGKVQVHPIAGTRPRGRTPGEDRRLEEELLADPKERAEHIMLVDLARNDLGRVAKSGSIRVDPFMKVERYSHVMHIVSGVEGQLRSGKDGFDLFAATFPAGTLSGAPKIRAMEIISELESSARGPYGGGVGYFGFDGNIHFCITIRTMVIEKNRLSIQAGAGIVYDSSPEKEYRECLHKAASLFKTIEKGNLHDPLDR